jgi:RNA polymerase sigma-70 factor (ECF subfamily)
MPLTMTRNPDTSADLTQLAAAGDVPALERLLQEYRPRLRRIVGFRLDPRARGRIDESDVIQEAYVEVTRRFAEYVRDRKMSLFVWIRFITHQKLLELHRHHLGAQVRDARREVSLYHGPAPEATSACLAAQLLGQSVSPSQAAADAEMKLQLQAALNTMDPLDREVLALRHFEHLENTETAEVLNITPSGASSRYLRALKRLKQILDDIPGFFDRTPTPHRSG